MSLQHPLKSMKAGKSIKAREPAVQMTIGELARTYDVTLRTLRFYEDRGLLVPKREGTARFYNAVDRTRLEAIIRLKNLGFTLTEIRGILAEGEKKTTPGDIKLRADQVTAQIAHLERQRREIDGALLALRSVQSAS